MNISQVAAQLYTVREFVGNPADIARSLKKLRAIGYQAVQVSGVGPVDPADLGKMIRDEGLVCCATHEGDILTNAAGVVDRLRKIGCDYTAYPYPGGVKFDTLENVKAFAAQLNAAGRILADGGKVLTYHNHHIEFQKVAGKVVLDILYDETDPRCLQGEIDTYWVQFGGGDPVAWCAKLARRLPLLHMKDYAINPESRVVFAEIGRGNLAWKDIVKTAEISGCKWFIVEQDTCPGDPFESLRISFDFIKANLCD